MVVGTPIDTQKVENPSEVQINSLHQKYLDGLIQIFETHKAKMGASWENKTLLFEDFDAASSV